MVQKPDFLRNNRVKSYQFGVGKLAGSFLSPTCRCLFVCLLICMGCSRRPTSVAYREFYEHLESPIAIGQEWEETDFFLVLLVDAPHLDYTDNRSFFRTLAKHPDTGSRARHVGHAWIVLRGIEDGQIVITEGGHSGETGTQQAKYFDGVLNNAESGDANPIKYLWSVQEDGFFQKGSGGHTPTFAAKITLTKQQYERILAFIHPDNYYYPRYSLTDSQCATFVTKAAALAGLYLDHQVVVNIDPTLKLRGKNITLWQDPRYSEITISTPDVLEKSLIQAVQEGKAEYALAWYRTVTTLFKRGAIHRDSHRMQPIVDIERNARNSRG